LHRFDTIQQCAHDGRTDGQTDGQTPSAWLRRAKHSAIARRKHYHISRRLTDPVFATCETAAEVVANCFSGDTNSRQVVRLYSVLLIIMYSGTTINLSHL